MHVSMSTCSGGAKRLSAKGVHCAAGSGRLMAVTCPCRLKFQKDDSVAIELQLISSFDVPNLRCLPVVKGDLQSAPSLDEVKLDSAYYTYQVVIAAQQCFTRTTAAAMTGQSCKTYAACLPAD